VGNIWMTNYGIPNAATPANGFNRIVKVTNTGAFIAEEVPPVQSGGATQSFQPVGLAVDKLNNVFFPYLSATGSRPNIVAFKPGPRRLYGARARHRHYGSGCPRSSPGIAIDSNGNIYGGAF